MLLNVKPKPQMTWISQNRPELVTPYSLTLVLAYLQYYTPKRLQNGHFLAVEHLRNLSTWISYPTPNLRSIRQHKVLAMHFVLLRAAQFISVSSTHLAPQPAVTRWLHLPQQEAITILLHAVSSLNQWQMACRELGLEHVIGLDNNTYLQQSFSRQLAQPVGETAHNLQGLKAEESAWHFHIPLSLPLWLQFDLRQLGDWTPTGDLICTPLTIAMANQRGYSQETMTWLLETAVQDKLSPLQEKQLHQWCRQADAYQLRTVHLLSTAQPSQMADVLRQKRLRNHVIDQLSPRHAVVSHTIVPQLEKWLAQQQIPLKHQQATDKGASIETSIEEQTAVQWSEQTAVQWSEQTAVQWLGTRILIGLSAITHQPIPSPYSLLEQLDAQLTPDTQSELEAIATKMLDGLRDAIRGRDAYLPAQQPVPQEMVALIQKAIWDETSLQIEYQPLGTLQPSWREIQPLRLEQRGSLYYLYAYCLRAETNLTFRLDRIHDIEK